MDIEATSITVRWTKPADDGGSPITAYRVLILRGNTEIENSNITDFTTMQLDIGGLTRSTNYTVKFFARNYVFEGKAAEKKIQTKFEGRIICKDFVIPGYSLVVISYHAREAREGQSPILIEYCSTSFRLVVT